MHPVPRAASTAVATVALLFSGALIAHADTVPPPSTNTNGASLINLQDILGSNNIGICDNAVNVVGIQTPVDATGMQGVLGLLTAGSPTSAGPCVASGD